MYFAYSADPRMRINVGIRRRLAPLLDNNRRRIELLNSLLLYSFPGAPIMYYGDEIGMGDNIYLGDATASARLCSGLIGPQRRILAGRPRTPVCAGQCWTPSGATRPSTSKPSSPIRSSLLHWTCNMIALRKLFKVFGRGTQEFLAPDNRKVLAYLRRTIPTRPRLPKRRPLASDLAFHRNTVLCVANLSRFAQPTCSLDLSPLRRHGSRRAARLRLLSADHRPTLRSVPGALLLPVAQTPAGAKFRKLPPCSQRGPRPSITSPARPKRCGET